MNEMDKIAMNSEPESDAVEKKPKIVEKEIKPVEKKLGELTRKFKDNLEAAKEKAKIRENKRIKRLASNYSSNAIKSQLKTASGYYKECLMAELKRRSEKK